MRRRLAVAIAVGAAVLIAIALLPSPAWLEAAIFIPLVLLAAGWGGLRLLPEGMGTAEATVYAFSFSVCAVALGGLVWQVPFSLNRTTWALLLVSAAALSVVATVAWRRPVARPGSRSSREAPRARLGIVAAVGFAVSVAGAGAAIAVATDGADQHRDRTRFATLWALPDAGTEGKWTIEVQNHGFDAHRYRLTVTRGPELIIASKILLDANSSWRGHVIAAPARNSHPIVASLYRGLRLDRVVELQSGGPE